MLRLLLAWLACVPAARLLVGSAPSATATYGKLQGVPLTRASDAATVSVTDLWRRDVAFGLGGTLPLLDSMAFALAIDPTGVSGFAP